ncbi:MAG: hypothetical protein ACI9WC_003932 [Arenicella sp.]|jgi:hypothetical protein
MAVQLSLMKIINIDFDRIAAMANFGETFEREQCFIYIDANHSDERIATQIRVAFALSKNKRFSVRPRSELPEDG